MPSFASGLIITPALTQHKVTVDLKFEPSVGILARKVKKFGADIRSFREPLKQAVKDVVIPSIRTNFDVEGRPPWAPLAEGTVRTRGSSGPILNRTGNLKRVATQLNIWTIDTEKAMITDLPQKAWYGKVHQAGNATTSVTPGARNPLTGRRGPDIVESSGGVPARPFVVLQDEDMEAIEEVFVEWVADRIARAGL